MPGITWLGYWAKPLKYRYKPMPEHVVSLPMSDIIVLFHMIRV